MKSATARAAPAILDTGRDESFDAFFARSLRRAPLLFGVVIVFFLLRAVGIRAMPIMLIGSSIPLLPLSLLRPELGLYALVFNFVNEFDAYYSLQQWIPVSLPILFDITVTTGILLRIVAPGRLPRLNYAQNQLLILYVALVVTALVASEVAEPGVWTTFRTRFLIRPIFYLFLVLLVQTPDQLYRLLVVWITAHTLVLMGAMSDFLQKGLAFYRIQGTLSEVNYLAYVCIVTLPILIALYLYLRDRIARNVMLGLALVTLFVTLQTLSRSGYFALLATLVFFAARLVRNPRTLMTVAAFGLVFYLLIPANLTRRLEQVTSVTETDRYRLSRIGLRMALDNPIVGVGPHAYDTEALRYDYEHFYFRPLAPHNLYLAIAATSGFPALLVYLALYGTTFLQDVRLDWNYRLKRETRALGYFLSLGIEGALVGHFVFGFAGSYGNSYYAYLLLGMSVILIRLHQPWRVLP
jgi:O-antigen ligase